MGPDSLGGDLVGQAAREGHQDALGGRVWTIPFGVDGALAAAYPEPPRPTSRSRIVGSDMGTPVDHRFWDVHGLRTIDPASVSLTRHASDQARDTIGMPGGGYPAPVLPG